MININPSVLVRSSRAPRHVMWFFSSPYLFLCIWSTPLPIKEGKTYNECLKTQLPYPWNIFLFVNDHFILQELIKSAKLEESMKELDIEKRRTDSLLYQMIPRTVADRLRQGEPALNTCEVCKFTTPCHLPVLIGHCN